MILTADFGGTTIKLGLVRDGRLLARGRLEARAEVPMPDQLERVAVEWEALLAAGGYRLEHCGGVSLALPFLADSAHSRVRGEFGKFPGAADVDFADWSRNRLGLRLVLENDLRLALLGEWTSGAAQGKADVVMLALGTGIGCAVICDGQLLRGANNRAATLLGHSTIAYQHPVGRCGNLGCAEDLASTATLAVRARCRPDFAGSALATAETIDYATVFQQAAAGDACAEALVQESLKVWAVVLQNAVLAFDPEIVVLGGGVSRRREIILPAMTQHLLRHGPSFPLRTPVVAAALGDDAALLGGATLFQKVHRDK